MDLLDFHTHGYGKNVVHNVIIGKEENTPDQLFSAGMHPWYLNEQELEAHLQTLQQLAAAQGCVAIGEAGLDKICETPWGLQVQAFEKQIELANQIKKPMVIHCVRAHQEMIKLKDKAVTPWVLHGFNQKATIGELILKNGLYISFGKALLQIDSNASHFVQQVPLERLFLETDDAEITIEDVYQAASERLHLPIEKLATNLQVNFEKLKGKW